MCQERGLNKWFGYSQMVYVKTETDAKEREETKWYSGMQE